MASILGTYKIIPEVQIDKQIKVYQKFIYQWIEIYKKFKNEKSLERALQQSSEQYLSILTDFLMSLGFDIDIKKYIKPKIFVVDNISSKGLNVSINFKGIYNISIPLLYIHAISDRNFYSHQVLLGVSSEIKRFNLEANTMEDFRFDDENMAKAVILILHNLVSALPIYGRDYPKGSKTIQKGIFEYGKEEAFLASSLYTGIKSVGAVTKSFNDESTDALNKEFTDYLETLENELKKYFKLKSSEFGNANIINTFNVKEHADMVIPPYSIKTALITGTSGSSFKMSIAVAPDKSGYIEFAPFPLKGAGTEDILKIVFEDIPQMKVYTVRKFIMNFILRLTSFIQIKG